MTVDIIWQVQEAKQRFSELLRKAETEGPQIVTRHGIEVAVVLSAEEYRRLEHKPKDLNDVLLNAPRVLTDDEVDELFARDRSMPREIDLSGV